MLVGFVPVKMIFNRHKSNVKIWFQKQGYPENIIENEMKKVKFPSCDKNEMKKVKFPSCDKIHRKKSKGILFVVTYHPLTYHKCNDRKYTRNGDCFQEDLDIFVVRNIQISLKISK